MAAGQRGGQQGLEPIGDAGECGMHDDRAQTIGDALAQDPGDVVPVGGGRHAGAAELEHDPA